VSAAEAISPTWWQQFRRSLPEFAGGQGGYGKTSNLKVLAARIEVANAQIGEGARGERCPSVDIAAGASLPKDPPAWGKTFVKQYGLGSQVSWDLDILGSGSKKGVQAQKCRVSVRQRPIWRGRIPETSLPTSQPLTFRILQLDEQIEQQQTRAKAKKRADRGHLRGRCAATGLIADTELLRQAGGEQTAWAKDLLELRRSRDVTEKRPCDSARRAPPANSKSHPGPLQGPREGTCRAPAGPARWICSPRRAPTSSRLNSGCWRLTT